MTRKRGWKCVLCGERTDTRRYAVLRLVGQGYTVETPWQKRLICDNCANRAVGQNVLVNITELRTAREPEEWELDY